MQKIKVAVVTGGTSAEHDIALRSGSTVLRNLPKARFSTRVVKIQRDGGWSLLPCGASMEALVACSESRVPESVTAELRAWGVDTVFLALHGPGGEDGSVQGYLRTSGIPFTGAGVEACALSMNKAVAKTLVSYAGVPVAEGRVLSKKAWGSRRNDWIEKLVRQPGLPVYVKPLHQGSSLGADRVEDPAKLEAALNHAFEFGDRVLVEREIKGREITCGVIGEGEGWILPLPPVEIRPRKGTFFDFESKYDPTRAEEICPAPLGDVAQRQVIHYAESAFRALGLRGMARVDFILSTQGPRFLELNAIPGLTPESILLKELAAEGIVLSDFLEAMVVSSLGVPFPPLCRGNRWRGAVLEPSRKETKKNGEMGIET